MKTGHGAIQLHTYGPEPRTCINLHVCMPSGSVLSVPGMCLPSGVYMCVCVCAPPNVRACAKCVNCRERVAGHGGNNVSCWVILQLPLCLPTGCPPTLLVTLPLKVNNVTLICDNYTLNELGAFFSTIAIIKDFSDLRQKMQSKMYTRTEY